MTKEAIEKNENSLMRELCRKKGEVDGTIPFAAAEAGDQTAIEVCREYGDYLAAGIVNLVNILHPERIAIGGGVAAAPEKWLLQPLQEKVAAECYGRHAGKYTEIVTAKLGNKAGLVGAAMLCRVV